MFDLKLSEDYNTPVVAALKINLKDDSVKNKIKTISEYLDEESYEECIALYSKFIKSKNIKYDLIYKIISISEGIIEPKKIQELVDFTLRLFKTDYCDQNKKEKLESMQYIYDVISNKNFDNRVVEKVNDVLKKEDKEEKRLLLKTMLNPNLLGSNLKIPILNEILNCEECFHIRYINELLKSNLIYSDNILKYIRYIKGQDDMGIVNGFVALASNKNLIEYNLVEPVLEKILKLDKKNNIEKDKIEQHRLDGFLIKSLEIKKHIKEEEYQNKIEILFDHRLYNNLNKDQIKKVLTFIPYFSKDKINLYIENINDEESQEIYDILYSIIHGYSGGIDFIQEFVDIYFKSEKIITLEVLEEISKYYNISDKKVILILTRILKDNDPVKLTVLINYMKIIKKDDTIVNFPEAHQLYKIINE